MVLAWIIVNYIGVAKWSFSSSIFPSTFKLIFLSTKECSLLTIFLLPPARFSPFLLSLLSVWVLTILPALAGEGNGTPTPVLLPRKSHGRRSLESCSPWGHWGSDMAEWLHFHFSLSCIGEGNGNPLQCSCLENPRDRGAWWAAVYGVTQSRMRLKWLSSSSRVWASQHKRS